MGQGAGEVNDPEVERLVEDIDETRDEMTVTVEEIGDRLDPKSIVEGAKDSVKAATVGKVEDMANTAEAMATEATETVREVGDSLVETIKRNPVPAAMVGVGIGWLLMSGRSSQGRNGYAPRGASWRGAYGVRAGDAFASGYDPSGGGSDPLHDAQQRVGSMASDAQHKVDEAMSQVGRVTDDVTYQARTMADDLAATASDMYRSNPLAMGAIAVAVGTAVGLALPATSLERRTLGEPAREALSRAGEVAGDTLEQVEDHARQMEEEAREEDRLARPH